MRDREQGRVGDGDKITVRVREKGRMRNREMGRVRDSEKGRVGDREKHTLQLLWA